MKLTTMFSDVLSEAADNELSKPLQWIISYVKRNPDELEEVITRLTQAVPPKAIKDYATTLKHKAKLDSGGELTTIDELKAWAIKTEMITPPGSIRLNKGLVNIAKNGILCVKAPTLPFKLTDDFTGSIQVEVEPQFKLPDKALWVTVQAKVTKYDWLPRNISDSLWLDTTTVGAFEQVAKLGVSVPKITYGELKPSSKPLYLLMVKGLKTTMLYDNRVNDVGQVHHIINKYLKDDQSMQARLLDCQHELIDAGLGDWAQL